MAYSRGSGKNCAIVNCRNNYKKLSQWKKSICDIHSCRKEDCACLLPFRLHSFPKDSDKRQQWVKAVNRKDFEPKVYSTVCSIHFVDGKPTKINPVPQLHLGYESKAKIMGYTPKRKYLKNDAVPTIFADSRENKDRQTSSNRQKRKAHREVEEWEECMETDDGDVVFQFKATGCDLPVKETIKLSTCEYLTTDENREARMNSDGTKSNHIEHPYYVPSINMGYSRESDQRIDSMGGNSSHNMGDNSSHINTGGNSTNYLFSDQVKVPRLQTKDNGTDRLNGNQSLEPELDNTDWRNNCVNFLKDALQNTINRLEDLGVDVAAWVLIPNNDKSSLIHQMGSKKGREFVKSKPDINTELHLFLQNYQKKDNGKKNNSKEISKKKLEEDSCSVENMGTSSCDGEPPESISENKAIPCSILNDCKPTNVLFSVKGLDDNSSCIVVRQAENSSKEELQVNTPCTSSSNEEKILLKRKIDSIDTDPLSECQVLEMT